MKVSLNAHSSHVYASMTALSASLRNAESCIHLIETREGSPIDCIPIPLVEVKPIGRDSELYVKVSCPICEKVMEETSKEVYNILMSFNEDGYRKSVSSRKTLEENGSKI